MSVRSGEGSGSAASFVSLLPLSFVGGNVQRSVWFCSAWCEVRVASKSWNTARLSTLSARLSPTAPPYTSCPTLSASPLLSLFLAALSQRLSPNSCALFGENMADAKHTSKCMCGEVEMEFVGPPLVSLHVSRASCAPSRGVRELLEPIYPLRKMCGILPGCSSRAKGGNDYRRRTKLGKSVEQSTETFVPPCEKRSIAAAKKDPSPTRPVCPTLFYSSLMLGRLKGSAFTVS